MGLISRFILLASACCALLAGIQLPGFVDQYHKRVDAHFIEVENNIKPFKDIADKQHGGSIESLIKMHDESNNQSFRNEGDAIRNINKRFVLFQREKTALQADLPRQALFIVTRGDRDVIRETWEAYSPMVLLNQATLLTGLACVAGVVFTLEIFMAILRWMWLPRANPYRR